MSPGYDSKRSVERPSVFISYAREDDEPFVDRLHRNLEAAGFPVWWDRQSMESRGRTFLQEIRDAIEGVDRVIAVIGPKAVTSDYVRYEWEHASLFAKVIVPIIREGDYDLIPKDIQPEAGYGLTEDALNRQHAEDFRSDSQYRQALERLIEILTEPVADLGSLDGTPALPPHFLPRRENIAKLQEKVLADVQLPTVITSSKQTTALQGMGGIGKSVLAATFARTITTRRAFEDGIIWLTAGREATKLDLLNNIKFVGLFFEDDITQYMDELSARARLPKVLADKVCLIVLDDIWALDQVEPFVNALGPRCRLLITTRDVGLVTAFGAQQHPLDVLGDEEAIMFLAEWSAQSMDILPLEQARQVAQECGKLPLALAMVGALVRDNPDRWGNALHRLRNADLDKIKRQFPNYPYPDLLRAIQVSVDTLEAEQQARYQDLAALPEDTSVPEAALQTLWAPEGLDEFDTQDMLDLFVRRSLARRDEQGRITLHDLQTDYVRKQIDDLPALHERLVRAYKARYNDGWASVPDDGYYYQYLPYHLAEAGRQEDLDALLADYDWISAKLKSTDVQSVLADYERASNEPDLNRIERALRLSTHALARDAYHLPSQLTGRLREFDERRIRALVIKAKSKTGAPWLCPRTASLFPPGLLLQTFTGHTGSVTSVAVLPDGRVVSGSGDNAVRVWDLASGESRSLTGHTGRVTSVAVLPDGRVVSGSEDKTVRVWDVASGESRSLTGHTGRVTSVAVLPNGRVVSGCWYGTVRVWDVESGETQSFTEHYEEVTSVAVLPDRRVVYGSWDREVSIWDVVSGKTRSFTEHMGPVTSVAVLPDGRVVSGSEDKTVRVWDVTSGESRSLTGHTDKVTSVAVLSDRRVVSGAEDNTVRVWDLATGESRSLTGHFFTVTSLAVLPDGRVVSGSNDGTMRVWDVASIESRSLTRHAGGWVTSVAVLPDGRVVSGSEDKTVRVWDVTSGESRSLTGHTDKVTSVAVLSDRRVVSGAEDNTVRVWDLATGESRSLTGHTDEVTSVVALPDGRVVSGSWDNTVRVWDLASGKSQSLTGHAGGVYSVAVLPDGRVVSGSEDKTVRVWDLATGESRSLTGHTYDVTLLAVLSDGRVVSGSEDKTVRVWDVASGESRSLIGHTGSVYALAVLPNGRVVSGSEDKTVRVWDVASGESRSLIGHTGSVDALAVLPNGRVVSGSSDWKVIVWDADHGVQLASFVGDAIITACAAIGADVVVAGSANGAVHILDLHQG